MTTNSPDQDPLINTVFQNGCYIHWLKHEAEKIGANTLQFVNSLWLEECSRAYYRVHRLLELRNRYGETRLERACERAFFYGQCSLEAVREILDKQWDRFPVAPEIDIDGQGLLFAE